MANRLKINLLNANKPGESWDCQKDCFCYHEVTKGGIKSISADAGRSYGDPRRRPNHSELQQPLSTKIRTVDRGWKTFSRVHHEAPTQSCNQKINGRKWNTEAGGVDSMLNSEAMTDCRPRSHNNFVRTSTCKNVGIVLRSQSWRKVGQSGRIIVRNLTAFITTSSPSPLRPT